MPCKRVTVLLRYTTQHTSQIARQYSLQLYSRCPVRTQMHETGGHTALAVDRRRGRANHCHQHCPSVTPFTEIEPGPREGRTGPPLFAARCACARAYSIAAMLQPSFINHDFNTDHAPQTRNGARPLWRHWILHTFSLITLRLLRECRSPICPR